MLCVGKGLYLGVELPEDGVNDAETCSSDVRRLYLCVSKVHLLVSWVNSNLSSDDMKFGVFLDWLRNC